MEAIDEGKDVLRSDEEATLQASSGSLPSASTPSSISSIATQRRRRITRQLTSLPLVSRTIRILSLILGPSTPVAEDEFTKPDPSFSLSLTLPNRSWVIPLDQHLRRFSHRFHLHWLLYPFLAFWAAGFVLLVRQQYYVAGPQIITCDSSLWGDWPPDTCGFNGTACLDGLEQGTYRCLGGCKDVPLGNPRWVGGTEVDSVPLVIGGNDSVYRADSWLCPSAIHAGIVSETLGGCVTVNPLAFIFGHSDFTASRSHGIQSTAFQPPYPGAYSAVKSPGAGCMDLHPLISFYNATCLLIATLFLRPIPAVLMMILVTLGWFHLTLISDPPNQPPDWSWVIGGLPAVLTTAYWAWKVSFRRTLLAFRDLPLDVTIWQGAGFWIGMESSIIFSKIPIQRLGYDKVPAAGVIALVIIIIFVAIIVLIQAWQMRRYGLLRYYLYRYLPLVPILIVLAFIPGYTLRLHHYLYTLAAIPVLSLPNRVSLFGQAFVFALFLDGVGRWGWASILQQTTSLIGDAIEGTFTPTFLPNSTADFVQWASTPATNAELVQAGFSGVAVMVDDLLRDTANITNSNYSIRDLNLQTGINHFIRLAYMANGSSLDYIDPVVLLANGSFTGPTYVSE